MTATTATKERLLAFIDKDGPIPGHRPELGPCWIWTGSTDEKGYGRFHDNGPRKAHRCSYELHVGEIPDGLEPDHLCRNRPCVNPGHLEVVTHRENCQRARYSNEECAKGHALPDPGPNGRRVCRECANERNRTYKQRVRESRPPKESVPMVHGRSQYTHHGCRCDVCCDAENEYKRQWRKDQKERVWDAVMGS
jgi:hypothetical protein